MKPHLLALFALWLIFEGVRTPFGRRVLLGGAVVGVLACVPPTLSHGAVWADYLRATTSPSSADHHHLSRWTPPLAGWWLRQAVPGHPFWVQWLPLGVAVVGFVAWYGCALRRPRGRPPEEHVRYLPFLVGASLLAAPYGVWQHDLVLLLVPIFAAAVRLAGRPDPRAVALGLGVLVSVNAVSLVMMLNRASSEWYVWFAPCVLLGCAAAAKFAGRAPAPMPSPAGA